jgi:dTDP-4-dehydrorhamnose reductase
VVVNCAAYNFVDRAETEPQAAFLINVHSAGELARWCGEHGRKLVHFSTDYVFGLDARRRTPWTETDAPGPVNVYGLSKLAGEFLVRSRCPGHMIIRSCGLYGGHGSGGKGTNFVETMLRLAGQGKPLRVVNDQVCTPTFTRDLARAAAALLARGETGLFHVTNAGSCSWYEFAAAILELAGLHTPLVPISTAEYGAVARRPAYSVLYGEGIRRAGLGPLRPWREALADFLHQRQNPPDQ